MYVKSLLWPWAVYTYVFKRFPIIPTEAPERVKQPEPHFPLEAPVKEKKEKELQEKKEEKGPEEENNE